MENWKTEIHFKETPIVNETDNLEIKTVMSGNNNATGKDTWDVKTAELSSGKKSKKSKHRKHIIKDTYRQGDVVVIDFGQPSDSRAPKGKRPCVIIFRDEIIKKSERILVIPLYR